MKTIRIDKGLGNAKVVINTNTISEFDIFNGSEEDTFIITSKILSQDCSEWTYDSEYLDDWKDLQERYLE